jgi:hypothetical protein
MSGIFDIIPLIISGLSLLSSFEGSGNKEGGKKILKECEEMIKRLSPYQLQLLKKYIELWTLNNNDKTEDVGLRLL